MHVRTRPRTATITRNAPRYKHWSARLLYFARRGLTLQHPATLVILFLCLPRNAYCSTMGYRYPRGINSALNSKEWQEMLEWVRNTPSPGIDRQLPVQPDVPLPCDSSLHQKRNKCSGAFYSFRFNIFALESKACACVLSRSDDALSSSPGIHRGAEKCIYISLNYAL